MDDHLPHLSCGLSTKSHRSNRLAEHFLRIPQYPKAVLDDLAPARVHLRGCRPAASGRGQLDCGAVRKGPPEPQARRTAMRAYGEGAWCFLFTRLVAQALVRRQGVAVRGPCDARARSCHPVMVRTMMITVSAAIRVTQSAVIDWQA